MKALEIYEQDIIDREQGNALPRQQYYAALRDALHRELMQQGFSDLLERVRLDLRGGLDRIYVIDYAALMECHSMIVLGRDMRDAAEYVPYLLQRGEKVSWSAVEGTGNFVMPVSRDLAEKLRELRSVSRQLVDAREDTISPQADDVAQREIEQVHLLNKMLEERCRSLQEERDGLQNRVRQLEEGVITEQVRYAIEARRIQEEEALRRTYAAQQEAARAAYRSQFAEEMAQAQRCQEEAERAASELREKAAAEYAAVRRDMGNDLAQVMQLLGGQITRWQNALDRSECRMLAQSYVSLNDLLTGDVAQLLLDAQCAVADAAVLSGLAALRAQLHSRLQQLEQAMLRLGMIVLRPAEGDEFNGAYHLSAGALADGAKIARCIRPGVMLQGAREALIRAEVEVN